MQNGRYTPATAALAARLSCLIIVLPALFVTGCSDNDDDDDDNGGGVDTGLPIITASFAPAANAAGWHNSDVTVSFQCSDADSGIATCPDPVLVDTEGEAQAVSGTAVDQEGNSASVTVTVNLDKTAPALSGYSPDDGATVATPGVNLTGTVADSLSGIVTVSCEDSGTTNEAALNDGAAAGEFLFGCSLPLTQGTHSIVVAALDVADNDGSATLAITHTPLPTITIDAPEDRSLVESSPLMVTGTIDDVTESVTVNGIPATLSSDRFEAAVLLESGVHNITAVGWNAAGTSTTVVRVVAVIGPPPRPTVHIVTPDNFVVGGQVGAVGEFSVSGWVRDNRDPPGTDAPPVTVNFDEISPANGSVLRTTTVDAIVTPGPYGLCWWEDNCWRFDADLPVAATEGFQLDIEAETETGSLTGSLLHTGLVDFCYQNNGDNNASGACGAALFQRAGCTQSRRCIENSDGCPAEFGATRNNPTEGTLGRTPTVFGRDESPGSADGAFTAYGQPRPVQLPCNRHDECYHQWCPTEGPTYAGVVAEKQACNLRFRDDLEAVCQAAYPEFRCPEGRIGAANCSSWSEEKNLCLTWARSYYEFVAEDADRYLVAGSHYDEWPYGGFLTPVAGCPAIQ